MIKVKHPDDKCNQSQAEFLDNCPKEQRRYHELIFCCGNASYRYHQKAENFNPVEQDYKEWLEGLPPNIQKDMIERGFEQCKSILSFSRYVNEKNDVGMEEYIKNLMGEEYQEYKALLGSENN
ncbi:hypothetical protein AAKU52_002596 [Pedobacter sp. CG_S7]|uniref:hypothetical protein n=1 Tax=Pedobacter sp. CG_S7 TaxID=3143930 RepID=UPI00339AAA95